MAKYKNDDEYLLIIDEIINNDNFKSLKDIKHHNTTRYNHCIKVSYHSYKIAKSLGLNYKEVARAGLLHDFYKEEICECDNLKDKLVLFSTKHPNDAVNNSLRYFDLSEKEINIIRTHMFPVNYRIPKYAESWVVSFVDKILSLGEVSIKFKCKLAYGLNLYLIFLLNIIK